MRTIWLVNPYGPIEGESWREYSFNQFGKFLSSKGYKVIWWTSSFSHHFKSQRTSDWKDIQVNDNYTIRLVPTINYKKNFGFGRLIKDWIFSINASRRFRIENNPDVIIAAENPMNLGYPAFWFAKKNAIPIIYDQMDIWPEFFVRLIRKPWSVMVNLLLFPVYRMRTKIYGHLSGAIALGKNYLNFMQEINPALSKKPKALIYNGIDVECFRNNLLNPIRNEKLNVPKNDEIWCIFAGTLGPSYDILTILKCAEICDNQGLRFRFIIAGSGPFSEEVKNFESQHTNLVFLGKLLPEDLIPIYGKCDIGFATYSEGSNVDMPDKLYDYTAGKLAIINSLKGEISDYISQYSIGVNYLAGSVTSMLDALFQFRNIEFLESCKNNSEKIAFLFDKNLQNDKLYSLIEQVLHNEGKL